jgi:hypothetical protein
MLHGAVEPGTEAMPVNRRSHQVRRRRWWRIFYVPLGLFLFLLGISVTTVEATDGMQGNRCVVESNEYIEHDFYFICRSLLIRGTIDGDLIGVASEVTIAREGVVTGDIWMTGGQLTIQGTVGDDLRFAGIDLDITDQVTFTNPRTDLTALALSVEISPGAALPGDLMMFGYQALLFGEVGGNIDFQGQTLVINGNVAGNVDAIVGDARQEINLRTIPFLPYSIRLRNYGLYIGDTATIQGNLRYEGAQQANIPRGAVAGTTRYEQVLERADITRAKQPRTFLGILRNYIVVVIQDLISLMLIGMVALQFAPILIIEPSARVQQSPIPVISWGLILFILFFPFALMSIIVSIILVLLITLISLSALTFTATIFFTIINLLFFFIFWFLLVYLGRAITCFLIGNLIQHYVRYYLARRKHDPDDPPIYIPPFPVRYRWIVLALGTVIYSGVVNLPLPSPVPTFELIFEALVALSGLGAIFMLGRDAWNIYDIKSGAIPKRKRKALPPRHRRPLELGLPDDAEVPLGLDNLPDGFEGFTD